MSDSTLAILLSGAALVIASRALEEQVKSKIKCKALMAGIDGIDIVCDTCDDKEKEQEDKEDA